MDSTVISSRFSDHPKGLYFLFFAELWERFSYYGLHALLILYMTKFLKFSDGVAIGVLATYGALIYMLPILGGIIADKYLGKRKCIIAGGALITLGHFAQVFVSTTTFYVGLALIVVGTGFFKANISSLLGDLYKLKDPRRDAGFTIYYVGINIGALLAPLLCGYVGERIGWHYGFSLAGFGMALGLYVFIRGADHLGDAGLPPKNFDINKKLLGLFNFEKTIYLLMVMLVPGVAVLLSQNGIFTNIMPIVGTLAVSYVLVEAFRSQRTERQALLAIVTLMIFHTGFFALFVLNHSTINLFTDRNIDRLFMGHTIPASQLLAINAIFIIIFGPIFSKIWMQLSQKKKNPHPPTKFILGLLFISLGFGTLVLGTNFANEMAKVSMFWLILAYMFITWGELCLAPVGLSMITKLAPARIASIIMGIWMLSISFAQVIAGIFARIGAVATEAGQVSNSHASLQVYAQTFKTVMIFGLSMAVLLMLVSPLLTRVFRGRELDDTAVESAIPQV